MGTSGTDFAAELPSMFLAYEGYKNLAGSFSDAKQTSNEVFERDTPATARWVFESCMAVYRIHPTKKRAR